MNTTVTDIPSLLKWIDTKRHHDGLTYADLAHQLGVSTSTISYWFGGQRKIPSDKLIALVRITGSDLILVRTAPPQPGKIT